MKPTRKDRVLTLLRAARDGAMTVSAGHARSLLVAPGGWLPGWLIASAEYGGSEGLRRLRELREEGHPIERQPGRDGRASWEYRLAPVGQEALPW